MLHDQPQSAQSHFSEAPLSVRHRLHTGKLVNSPAYVSYSSPRTVSAPEYTDTAPRGR